MSDKYLKLDIASRLDFILMDGIHKTNINK